MKSSRGFTLVEVLISMAVLAAIASLVFAVTVQVKASALRKGCIAKMNTYYLALGMYRSDYGNPGADSGSAAYLGLPFDLALLNLKGYEDDGKFYKWFHCPLWTDTFWGKTYGWNAHSDEARPPGPFTFDVMTDILRGGTPILTDLNHNPFNDDLLDPKLTRRVLYITLSGTARDEMTVGLASKYAGRRVEPGCEDIIRWKAPEAYKKLKQEDH